MTHCLQLVSGFGQQLQEFEEFEEFTGLMVGSGAKLDGHTAKADMPRRRSNRKSGHLLNGIKPEKRQHWRSRPRNLVMTTMANQVTEAKV